MFGVNRSKLAVIRYLVLHSEGATSGTISRDLKLTYHTVLRHLTSLEEEGVVTTDTPETERHGKRVTYTLDVKKLREQQEHLHTLIWGDPTPEEAGLKKNPR